MIKSQKEYLATQEKLKALKDSNGLKIKAGVPNILKRAAQGQTKELIEELENEIKEYESRSDPPHKVLKNLDPGKTIDEIWEANSKVNQKDLEADIQEAINAVRKKQRPE